MTGHNPCVHHFSDLFAFQNAEVFPLRSELLGWPLYDAIKEFKRQGLSDDQWRVANYNSSFALTQYPSKFIVPAATSDGPPHPYPCMMACRSTDSCATITDALGQLQDNPLKWQRWIMALCWQNTRAPVRGCLLRSSETTIGGLGIAGAMSNMQHSAAPFDSFRLESKRQQPGTDVRTMMREVLLLHPRADALHIFSTSKQRKKLNCDSSVYGACPFPSALRCSVTHSFSFAVDLQKPYS